MVMEKGGWTLEPSGLDATTYPLWVTGRYYGSNLATALSTLTLKQRMYATPIFAPGANGSLIDELGLEITAGGTAGGVARVGIYEDYEGVPWDLLLDAGTIPIDGVGWQHVDVALRLRGWVWLAVAFSNYAATPTYRSVSAYVPVLGFTNPVITTRTGGYIVEADAAIVDVGLFSRFPVNTASVVLPVATSGLYPRTLVRAG